MNSIKITQNFVELNEYCVLEIQNQELSQINGGIGWGKIWDAALGYIVGEIIDGVGRGLAKPCKPCPCN